MSKSLERLRELTDNLSAYPEVTKGDGYFEVDMEKGSCFGQTFYEEGNITVSGFFNSKDSRCKSHSHMEKEWLIVFKGEMVLAKDGKLMNIKAGDYIVLEPDELHSAEFFEDTKYVAITIPSTKDWGNNGRT